MEESMPTKIMLVEDDPGARRLVELALKQPSLGLDFRVTTVSCLAESLKYLQSNDVDLVLLDLGLPDSQGLETLEKVRTACSDIPVVVLTCLASEEAGVAALRKGASDYLVKGKFPMESLVRTIRYALERQRLEGRLRKAAEVEGLNHQLKGAIARASQLADEAKAANRAKSEFLAKMSHEIRTPLNSLITMIELVLDDRDLSKENRDYLLTAKASARRLLELLSDILEISKIEAGTLTIKITDCTVTGILSTVDAIARPQATEKGLSFDMVLKTPVPREIRTDPIRVYQCLLNLTSNAVKFTETGSVAIHISLETRAGEAFIRFDVVDTGVGIPVDRQTYIFDKFTQVDDSSARKHGGSGLGLAIATQISQALGGSLSLSSEPGKGSVFSLLIPALVDLQSATMISGLESDEEEQRPDTTAQASGLAGRILVAEDDLANQTGIRVVLARAGLEVEIAADGVEAVDKAASASYDLILMDMQMPNMDGYDATKSLREKGFTIPIIALTAHAMDGDSQKCIDAGCDAYLPKPVDRAALYDTLRRYLTPQAERVTDSTDAVNSEPDQVKQSTCDTDVQAQAGADPSQEQDLRPVIDWVELEGRFGADAVIKEVVGAFFVDNPARVAALADAIRAQDAEAVRSIAHALKGSAATIAATPLSQAASELDKAAKKDDLETAEWLLSMVQTELDSLTSFVSRPDWIETAKQQCEEQTHRVGNS